MFALYAGFTGYDATAEDCADYAEYIGDPAFPVFADGDRLLHEVTPMDGRTHPELCAVGPGMTILGCWSGHGSIEPALAAVREHAGI